jgi:arylsulfatase A-like enzyme
MLRWTELLLLIAVTCLTPAHAAVPHRPNIVFILADDLGTMDLGCYGSRFYETPNLDRLAARGMRFTQAYAACPVCSPTRASILTGKYPARVGVTDYINPPGNNQPAKWTRNTRLLPAAYRDRLAVEERTLAEALKEAGYATGHFGKWHLGPGGFYPENQGFDVNKGGCEKGATPHFPPYALPNLPDGPTGEYLADRLTDEALQFVDANRDRPFFLYLPFYDVHTPLVSKPEVVEKYRKKAEKLPPGTPRFRHEGASEDRRVQDHAVYAAMMECLDQDIGRLLARLDSLGIAEHTIVIFFSDNGGLSTAEGAPTSNAPLRAGKGWLYEGGIREPLLVRWPGVTRPGSLCDVPVISTDFYPTLLEAAGLPLRPRQHRDGVSLVPLLKGTGQPAPRPFFWHYPHYGNQGGAPGGIVRAGDEKLIEFYEDMRVELYNLHDDPGEQHDLAAQKPEKVKALRDQLHAWRAANRAIMPAPNPNFKPAAETKAVQP